MRRLKIEILEAWELWPWRDALRALEGAITYPLDDQGLQRFTIDHGQDYEAFFSRRGPARFMIASDERGELLGTMAGCWHKARLHHELFTALYMGDLKLSPAARGQRVVHKMAAHALYALFTQRRLRGWSIVYGAAMQGARGDVTRSMTGAHAGRLLEPMARLALYFTSSQALQALDLRGCPVVQRAGLNLSPTQVPWRSNMPEKTLRLLPEHKPWPLIHLTQGPGTSLEPYGHYLRQCGQQLAVYAPDHQVCFALDERLIEHKRWLSQRGLEPGGACMIYGLKIDALLPRITPAWLHLAPCDI